MIIQFLCMIFFSVYQPNVAIEHRDMIRLITCNNVFERMKSIDLVSNQILGYQRQRVLPVLYSIIYLNPQSYHVHPQQTDQTT
jgi:hypothetical protein